MPVSLIAGTWVTEAESEVTIEPCEAGHCGYLSKIVVPGDEYAANKEAIDTMVPEDFRDYLNKDESLRNRPLLGLQLLTLNEKVTPVRYKGEVYNPQDGNTYYGEVAVIDLDTIELTGCGFFNLVCKSEAWTRAPEENSETTASE